MRLAVREDTLRALADAAGRCEEAGIDPWAALSRLARERGWAGPRKGWKDEWLAEAEGCLVALADGEGEVEPGPDPVRGEMDRLQRADDVIETLVQTGQLRPAATLEEPPSAAERIEREKVRRKLDAPPPARPKGRFPWLKAVEEHFAVEVCRPLDDWHRKIDHPVRTEDWTDRQHRRAVAWVECKAMALASYAGEFGPVPDATALMDELLGMVRPLARSQYGTEAPTDQHLLAVLDRLYGQAVATRADRGKPLPAESIRGTFRALTERDSLLPLRLLLIDAEADLAELDSVVADGGPEE
jgi:hypothetical protein